MNGLARGIINILLVEDNPADVSLVREAFSNVGNGPFEITQVTRLTEALALLELEKKRFNAVLLDLMLPDEQGIDTFLRVNAAVPDMPVIIMSGLNDEALATKAMHLGAQDYLIKGESDISALPHAVRYAIERQEVESELKAARRHAEEATRLKDKFVSLVAHDLQAPLNSVSTLLKIAAMDTEEPLPIRHARILERVLETVEGMTSLIEELLNISRLQTGSITPQPRFIDAAFAAMSVTDRLAHAAAKKGVALVNDVPPRMRLYADLNLYSEVLFNVVSNAIKFSKQGGTIHISAPPREPGVITVRDEGTGMEAAALAKLFKHEEKFTTIGTAGEKGTGLGMPLAHDIMQAHHGVIRAESTPGAGSIFYIALPEVKPEILIVDDDQLTRIMLKGQLEELKALILEAGNGNEALTLLESRLPHLIIIDIMMPMMDGLELLERLRKNPKTQLIPTIVITSNSDSSVREKAFRLGADDFIAKPFAMEELIPRVRRFIV